MVFEDGQLTSPVKVAQLRSGWPIPLCWLANNFQRPLLDVIFICRHSRADLEVSFGVLVVDVVVDVVVVDVVVEPLPLLSE